MKIKKFLFKTQSLIQYKNLIGRIQFVNKSYFTFTPDNTTALIVVYREDWNNVTILEVAQDT
jgi:hypothetical protein